MLHTKFDIFLFKELKKNLQNEKNSQQKQPKVEIIVSKSVYEQISRQIQDSATLGWLVGGAKVTLSILSFNLT